ncbi:YqaA family protein [Desulfofustis glycolicus]|uniref:Membrane protein YqaA, SNARE-associated domain n=1 Tax=Desulfofustis glycolicus DSM 9705 TaxID=1121409 RepID=A0A1M5YBJ7_9BACT|nr:YqaA family protein [Desulfofustis glycolicus]MCB2217732.1 DedA family protein [Desulfobulbaceae bacterium]SHI09356.1 membrane protein YqaA, SNARE-associated domain [Desulfofustis glycolicus DSM 9705]
MTPYLILFSFSFLAATVLPFSSEVVLYALIRSDTPALPLILAASTGNTLGAIVNWGLGRYLLHYRDRPWFYFKQEQIDRAQRWFQHYGIWTLLFSWLPLGGDVLTFIAGVMRVKLWLFVLLVGIGKSVRYLAVLYLARWQFLP